jgi:hypothetical protein
MKILKNQKVTSMNITGDFVYWVCIVIAIYITRGNDNE